MQNKSLAKDYISRSQKRMKAIETLMKEEAWADVVRESQEVLELTLKALLRTCAVDVPRIHDVSGILLENQQRLPQEIQKNLGDIVTVSKSLRRDRELAFYGSEDLTPSEFYSKKDASEAFKSVRKILDMVSKVV